MQNNSGTRNGGAWSFTFTARGLILGSQVNRLALGKYTSARIVKLCCALLLATCAILLLVYLTNFTSPKVIIGFMLASWLVSFLHNGSAVVMPGVIFGCSVVAFLALFNYRRSLLIEN